jgi:maltooligosyltrehalose trehalohydrolase
MPCAKGAGASSPNSRFERSVAYPAGERGETRGDLYRRLLGLRAAEIVPRLPGSRSVCASAVGPAAVVACWRLGDGALLTLACNLGEREAPLAGHTFGRLLFQSADVAKQARAGMLAPYATVAFLDRQS